jgi:hypothetical protein
MSESQQPPVPAFQPSTDYLARAKRMDDAMHLRKPDRVPVAPLVCTFYPTKVKGVSNRDAMYRLDVSLRAWKEVTIAHNWDAAPPPTNLMPARPMEILGLTQFKWPGGGLADGQPFQWVEGEYMKQDEYDEMLADPNGFAVKKLWPRISTTLAPLSGMMQMPTPPLLLLSNAYSLPGFLGTILSQPPMAELLRKALDLAEDYRKNTEMGMAYTFEMMNLGFPIPWAPATFPAFDWVSDTLRGLKGSSLDMYQVPDKLLATIDMLTPQIIGGAVMWAGQAHSKGVFVPMHRGAAGFMSDKQFAKFYWPCFKALMLGLIDAGLTPMPLFEGDYTPRLEYLAELPPGKVVGHFDSVDRKKAKKLLGDVMCFWGNVPASLMCTGTPQQVQDDVKELIDIFGDNGGLIIDSTMGLPDESQKGNVQALTEAVHEYGVW